MMQFCYLMLGLFLLFNNGQQLCQSNLQHETRSVQKGKKHRVSKTPTKIISSRKDELVTIGNKLKSFSTIKRSSIKKKSTLNKIEKVSIRKPIKINNFYLKNKLSKSNSKKSINRKTENIISESILKGANKESLVDGEEWIAAMDYLEGNRSLFLTRPTINDFDIDIKELSTSQILESGTPITALVDGSAIIFVDIDYNIRYIKTDGSDEQLISTSSDWYSVSISPDGTKLAAISDIIEPYIHLIDLINPDSSKTIRIYNPLSDQGINDTTLQYPDALTWDSNGEQIYYDCFVSDIIGKEYWTINLLDLSNGNNVQLFELEDPYEVWGPSASHNEGFLLLDLHDTVTDSISILLVDFNEDLPGLIEENGMNISNSKFSPLDDMVVFEYFDSLNGSIVPILSKIELSEDKRIPVSPSEQFIDSFRYPVWFIIGGIPVSVEIDETKTVSTKFNLGQNYPNPFNPTTAISYSIPNNDVGTSYSLSVQLKIYDILGNEVTDLVNEFQSPGNYMVNFDGSRLSSGIYYYQLRAGNLRESKKMLLLK